MTTLISFDIDGTLEVGDPPGVITMDMVRAAKALGFLLGSCSDRTLGNQSRMWREHNISVDFTSLKHEMAGVRSRFQAEEYYHIGDGEMDRFFAERAGFSFVLADDKAVRLWSPGLGP